MSADKFFLVATILALGIAVAIAMFGA